MVFNNSFCLHPMDHSLQQHHDHHQTPKPTAHAHHKEADQHAGHDKHTGRHTPDFIKRFWKCFVLIIPVLVLSPHDTGFVWLSQADVIITVGSCTDVAAQTADIILVNNDPKDAVQMIEFGRKTNRKMIKNLA